MPYKDKAAKKAWAKRQQQEKLAFIQAYKVEKGCVDCGYNAHPEALHFDHVRGDKLAGVTKLTHRSWDLLFAEITKCEVRCANCHYVVTALRR